MFCQKKSICLGQSLNDIELSIVNKSDTNTSAISLSEFLNLMVARTRAAEDNRELEVGELRAAFLVFDISGQRSI